MWVHIPSKAMKTVWVSVERAEKPVSGSRPEGLRLRIVGGKRAAGIMGLCLFAIYDIVTGDSSHNS